MAGRGGVHGGGVRIGSSVSEIRAGLPLPLWAGCVGVQGGGVRIGSSVCDCDVDELIVIDGSIVSDGKVSDTRLIKQSSGGEETETSKILDITVL